MRKVFVFQFHFLCLGLSNLSARAFFHVNAQYLYSEFPLSVETDKRVRCFFFNFSYIFPVISDNDRLVMPGSFHVPSLVDGHIENDDREREILYGVQ